MLTFSCKSNIERTTGCQEVSTSVDHIQTSSVDVDRELSRIHTLCVTDIDKFDSVLSEYNIDLKLIWIYNYYLLYSAVKIVEFFYKWCVS